MTTPQGPSGPPAGQFGGQVELPVCFRHGDRPTGLRCSRCDRPACPECLREASVGYQCVDCVAQGARTQRPFRQRTIAGAELTDELLVVPVLIAVNVLVYVFTAIQAHSIGAVEHSPLFGAWAEFPLAVANGNWWQLITAGFLHVTPIHIVMNMLSLWWIGKDLERILGRIRFTAVYLVSLLGGGVSVLLFADPQQQVAGASGAVFGLLGGVLVVVLRLKLNPGAVIATIVINLVLSVAIPGISVLGHVGGLVVGGLMTAAIIYAPEKNRNTWQFGAVAVAVVALIGLVLVRDTQLAALL
ncbi:MAG TPA: rhomboid family intramembrane serine protease [Pseudonocardiaceae bacterium]|jgi:membrane associated rhomboid family serine protease|nr:rhomboid family intramembrane serine protease [Pseudonocardiaceae bacterium]